ncbi:MAG: hypothetical protein HYX57_03460 [Chloroflexi bacterium]|nr:hypothetical protein [Chloroflexota bacterium]
MIQSPGSFRPGEFDGADRGISEADLLAAATTASELERALPMESIAPSAGFADRIMAAVAREPAPRPLGFLAGLRAHPGPATFVASVLEAWGLATHGSGRPSRARGLALAYVLAVILVGTSITGFAAYGWAGALGILPAEASPSPSPSLLTPSPSPSPSPDASEPDASGSALPGESTEPSESSEPSESPGSEPSDDGAGTAEPDRSNLPTSPSGSAEPSDDHGGSPSSSPDDSSSPEPSDTPRPSDTPKPSQTPN